MTINYSALKSNLELLDDQETNIKEVLKDFTSKNSKDVNLENLVEDISSKLEMEEKVMEKIGLSLTPFHQDEHKNCWRKLHCLNSAGRLNASVTMFT